MINIKRINANLNNNYNTDEQLQQLTEDKLNAIYFYIQIIH